MKKIGIIFAMQEEINALKKEVKIIREKQIYNCTFYEAVLNNQTLILVESGIGKVNAARCCQMLIDYYKVDYIFNIGVAGSTTAKVKIGDIVVGEKLVQHDFDISAFNHEKGYIPKIGTYISASQELLNIAIKSKKEEKIHQGVIASGDIFCTDYNKCKEIYNNYKALCVEMEGASVMQVATLDNIPALVIRSISDSPQQGNNTKDHEDFLNEMASAVTKYLIRILKNIKDKK